LACPYFVPREILNDGSWLHPSRLPLGAGWSGACCGSGQEVPAEEAHIREFCNLGYAKGCPHLPETRDWDAVRFCVARISDEQIEVQYACERGHAPIAHGTLTYELKAEGWREAHADPRINRLAASYLQVYRARRSGALI
jgi:hypothetical protein